MADCMCRVFENYRKARVKRIERGKSKGIRIDVVTNLNMLESLERDEVKTRNFLLEANHAGSINIITNLVSNQMENKSINVKGSIVGSAIGDGANNKTGDISVEQHWRDLSSKSKFDDLERELSELKEKLASNASSDEHHIEISSIANAEQRASQADERSVMQALSKAGKWSLDMANKLGLSTASAAIKHALGI